MSTDSEISEVDKKIEEYTPLAGTFDAPASPSRKAVKPKKPTAKAAKPKKSAAKAAAAVPPKKTTKQAAKSAKAVPPLKNLKELTAASRKASLLLKMASDATRVAIILILFEGRQHVTALCQALSMNSQPALSHHLALMRHGGIVDPERAGKQNFYSLTEKGRALAKVVKILTDN